VCRIDGFGDERVVNLWANNFKSFYEGCHLWLVVKSVLNEDKNDTVRQWLLRGETFCSTDIQDGRAMKIARATDAEGGRIGIPLYVGCTNYPANGSVKRVVPDLELKAILEGKKSAKATVAALNAMPHIHVYLGVGRALALNVGHSGSVPRPVPFQMPAPVAIARTGSVGSGGSAAAAASGGGSIDRKHGDSKYGGVVAGMRTDPPNSPPSALRMSVDPPSPPASSASSSSSTATRVRPLGSPRAASRRAPTSKK
jgi:hypothetical protein